MPCKMMSSHASQSFHAGPLTGFAAPLITLLSLCMIDIMPKSPTPTNHVPSGLQAICEVAKCCLDESVFCGMITVACCLSGVKGSLRANLRSGGAEFDVDEGNASQMVSKRQPRPGARLTSGAPNSITAWHNVGLPNVVQTIQVL